MPGLGNDPAAFIRHNLLTLDGRLDNPAPAMLSPQGTVLVKLVDVTGAYGVVKRNRNRKGLARLIPSCFTGSWEKVTRIYQIEPANQGEVDAFQAYICPYSDNAFHQMMLGADADAMFTGDMDGCTFGVGMPNPQGGVRVGHVNAQNQATGGQWTPNFAPQRQAQSQTLHQAGLNTGRVEPDVYRDNAPRGSEFKAVTIGLRIGGQWEFYYQHQHMDGDDYRNKLATVRI